MCTFYSPSFQANHGHNNTASHGSICRNSYSVCLFFRPQTSKFMTINELKLDAVSLRYFLSESISNKNALQSRIVKFIFYWFKHKMFLHSIYHTEKNVSVEMSQSGWNTFNFNQRISTRNKLLPWVEYV